MHIELAYGKERLKVEIPDHIHRGGGTLLCERNTQPGTGHQVCPLKSDKPPSAAIHHFKHTKSGRCFQRHYPGYPLPPYTAPFAESPQPSSR